MWWETINEDVLFGKFGLSKNNWSIWAALQSEIWLDLFVFFFNIICFADDMIVADRERRNVL